MIKRQKTRKITMGAVIVAIIALFVWLDFHVPLAGKVFAFFTPVLMALLGYKTDYRTFFITASVSILTMYLMVTNPLYPISRGLISFILESLLMMVCFKKRVPLHWTILFLTGTLTVHWFVDLYTLQLMTGLSVAESIKTFALGLFAIYQKIALFLHLPVRSLLNLPLIFLIIGIFIARAWLVATVYVYAMKVLLKRVR